MLVVSVITVSTIPNTNARIKTQREASPILQVRKSKLGAFRSWDVQVSYIYLRYLVSLGCLFVCFLIYIPNHVNSSQFSTRVEEYKRNWVGPQDSLADRAPLDFKAMLLSLGNLYVPKITALYPGVQRHSIDRFPQHWGTQKATGQETKT